MGKCAWDVSAQSERHKNGSGETYRPEVNHFVWSLLCDTFFVPLVARICIIIIRSFVILHRPLMGKKCVFYILFLKTFSSSRVSEYSVYSAFQNIQYFPCFRIFRVFRILEYSVGSAIPFHRSTIPSFRRIESPHCKHHHLRYCGHHDCIRHSSRFGLSLQSHFHYRCVIHLIPKWRPINYSFVCMLISPLCLIFISKFFCFLYMLTKQRGLIYMQTKE